MPLSKVKKEQIVKDVSDLLSVTKMTVVANYKGTPVKSMQELRRQAKENGTTIKVIKNRLVMQALAKLDQYKEIDISLLEGMLAYAFNDSDEVAAATSLANFAKNHPTLDFVGAITPEGNWLSSDEVKVLAALPSKPQLIASVVALLGTPIRSVISASNNLPGIIAALETNVSKA